MSTSLSDRLVGSTVNRISISGDHELLSFETDKGVVTLQAEGDCCSYTWFNDVINPQAILGSPVLSVEDIEREFPEATNEDTYYGFAIKTTQGGLRHHLPQ